MLKRATTREDKWEAGLMIGRDGVDTASAAFSRNDSCHADISRPLRPGLRPCDVVGDASRAFRHEGHEDSRRARRTARAAFAAEKAGPVYGVVDCAGHARWDAVRGAPTADFVGPSTALPVGIPRNGLATWDSSQRIGLVSWNRCTGALRH